MIYSTAIYNHGPAQQQQQQQQKKWEQRSTFYAKKSQRISIPTQLTTYTVEEMDIRCFHCYIVTLLPNCIPFPNFPDFSRKTL